jgi:3-hydroxyacyl-CoA dehydrogenase
LNWRVVFAGPGGPIELALRQALSGAVAHLEVGGIGRDVITAALAAYGTGTGPVSILPQAPPGAEGIVACCVAAMAAEGARMVQDGRARQPLHVDAVALMSGLMPRWQGGPMFQADQRGLLLLRQDLMAWAEHNPLFIPPELIDDLIADGHSFASLNNRF